eukprot:scaffold21897_cov59-Phaeocystis_antarctica.AAC.7
MRLHAVYIQWICSATATDSRSLPRASIRAAVRAPWRLCSAAEEESQPQRRRRGPPAAAAAAGDRHASRLSRSLAGWRCFAARAAAARISQRPYLPAWAAAAQTRQGRMRRRWKEGIPSI